MAIVAGLAVAAAVAYGASAVVSAEGKRKAAKKAAEGIGNAQDVISAAIKRFEELGAVEKGTADRFLNLSQRTAERGGTAEDALLAFATDLDGGLSTEVGPGFALRLREGQRALENRASLTGGLDAASSAAARGAFVSNLTAREFDATRALRINVLQGLAGLGAQTSANVGTNLNSQANQFLLGAGGLRRDAASLAAGKGVAEGAVVQAKYDRNAAIIQGVGGVLSAAGGNYGGLLGGAGGGLLGGGGGGGGSFGSATGGGQAGFGTGVTGVGGGIFAGL